MGDKDIETVPHQLWQFCVARPGHYCAIEEAAADVASMVGGAAGGDAKPVRRQSFFFGLIGGSTDAAAGGPDPARGSIASDAARAGVIIPPQVATAREKPVSRPRNIFGF